MAEVAKHLFVQALILFGNGTPREAPSVSCNGLAIPLFCKGGIKGGSQDIFFLTTLDKTPEFIKTMYAVEEACRFPTSDIGVYLQPVHQGASCHCEFHLPFDRDNAKETDRMREFFTMASEALLKQGAYFSRPYGIWANMAYSHDAQTTAVLKKLKVIFDPNNVMNPGKLCF